MNVTDAVDMALDEIGEWLDSDWGITLTRKRRVCGSCNIRARVIELSAFYIKYSPEAEVMDTIRHEIAHALAGHGHGHDHVWRAKCRLVGARPQACTEHELPDEAYPWIGSCPVHGVIAKYFRRPNMRRKFCGPCPGLSQPVIWTHNGRLVEVTPGAATR